VPALKDPSFITALLACAALLGACKAKASASQCDQLIDRYATLVVTEKLTDASAAQIQTEQTREKSAARGDAPTLTAEWARLASTRSKM